MEYYVIQYYITQVTTITHDPEAHLFRVSPSLKTHLLRPTRKVKYCKKELELIFGALQRAPASRSVLVQTLATTQLWQIHKAKTQSCASSSFWSDLPREHLPKSSRSCSQARDETWPKWVITENKTRKGFWIYRNLQLFSLPLRKSWSSGPGKKRVFFWENQRTVTLSTEFPAVVKFSQNKVHICRCRESCSRFSMYCFKTKEISPGTGRELGQTDQ